MLAAAVGSLLPPVEDGGQDLLQPIGVEQPLLQMLGDEIVSFSIGTAMPSQAVGPCRALVELVAKSVIP